MSNVSHPVSLYKFSSDTSFVVPDRFGGGSIMVWGGIMGNLKNDLVIIPGNVNAQRYINVLNNTMILFMQNNRPGISSMTMLDLIQPYNHTIPCLYNVNVFPRRTLSPDMIPIEHVCDDVLIS